MSKQASDTILFADGNASFLMYVSILVKRLGYTVLLARDGMEALRLARQERPAIVVLDHALPKLDGPACLKMMRSDAFLADTAVLMLSADGDERARDAIAQLDLQGHLTKPLNVTEFYLAIQKCLKHSIKRGAVRATMNLAVDTRYNGKQHELTATDLAVEGTFLNTQDPFPLGSILDLVFDLGDGEDPIELRGEVVSVRPAAPGRMSGGGVGVRFLDIPEDVRFRLYYVVMRELTRNIGVGGAGEIWFNDTLNAG